MITFLPNLAEKYQNTSWENTSVWETFGLNLLKVLVFFSMFCINGELKDRKLHISCFFRNREPYWNCLHIMQKNILPAAACTCSLWLLHSSPESRWRAAGRLLRSAGSPHWVSDWAPLVRLQFSQESRGWSRCPLWPRFQHRGWQHLPTEEEGWRGCESLRI